MSVSRSLEILKAAIRIEKEGYEFYTENAQKVTDPTGKAMFTQLAKDELDHQRLLEMEYDSLAGTGKWRKVEKLPDRVFPSSLIFPLIQEKKKSHDKPAELKALEIGIELERRSEEFYSNESERTSEVDEKVMFNHFAEIERGHLAILEAERDHLRNTGYWFDFREISLE